MGYGQAYAAYPGYSAASYPAGYPQASAPAYAGATPAGYPAAAPAAHPAYGAAGSPYAAVPGAAAAYPGYPGYPPAAYPGYGAAQAAPAGSSYGYAGAVPAASAASRPRSPEALMVAGCQHGTVGGIVRGNFTLTSENHGKPVYRKDVQVNGLDVMLYFWDDRDGPNFCGWWFGPKVGGDQVWAYHPVKEQNPPTSGWKVPYDGPVDNTFTITFTQGKTQAQAAVPNPYTAPPAYAAPPGMYGYGQPAVPGWDQAEMYRRQQDDARRREEARVAEEKKKQEAERKRQEEMRKKREEEQKRKNEEMKRKKEIDDKQRAEQKAILAIRRVTQKARLAQPENLDALVLELEEALKTELNNTGAQKDKIKEEAEQGLQLAKKRVEGIIEQRKKDQERKEAEDKRRQEAEVKAKELIKELETLVDAAESTSNALKDIAQPPESEDEMSLDVVESLAQKVEEAGNEAKAATKACTDFIMANGAEMKDPSPTLPTQPPSEMKLAVSRLLQRINDCSKLADATVQSARGAKDKAVRKVAARARTKEMEVLFERYDKDMDAQLSKKEVLNYAKSELSFVIPEALADAMMKNLVEEGQKGVKLDRFTWMNMSIGIARELDRDRKRRKLRHEKEEQLRGKKLEVQERLKQVSAAADEVDKEVARVEKKVAPLLAQVKSTPEAEMLQLADQVDDMIKVVRVDVGGVRTQLERLADGLEEKFKEDLLVYLKEEAKTLEIKIGRFDHRLSRTTNLSARFREQALKKRMAGQEKSRAMALQVVRYNQKRQKIDNEALFKLFKPNKAGCIGEKQFLDFFATADRDIKELNEDGEIVEAVEEKKEGAEEEASKAQVVAAKKEEKIEFSTDGLKRLHAALAAESGKAEGISKETFMRLIRVCYKVVKETSISDGLSIAEGKTMRTMALNEVVELLEGPMKEGSVDVMRIKAKAMKDGIEGWLTLAGNQGTVYLQEGGCYFKVVKETFLSEDMNSIGETGETEIRKLKESEVLLVHEFPQKHEESGHFRMKAKARADGAIGWLTSTGADGTVFAELL